MIVNLQKQDSFIFFLREFRIPEQVKGPEYGCPIYTRRFGNGGAIDADRRRSGPVMAGYLNISS
jgi:hypothetical protein